MTTTAINLNHVQIFKPIEGKTLGEQLKGKKLAGREVVDYVRGLTGAELASFEPKHWPQKPQLDNDSTWVYAFSLTYIAPRHEGEEEVQIHGFNWAGDRVSPHYRYFRGDIMECLVGEDAPWHPRDWILIEV